MQTNLFTSEQINKESSVGELYRAENENSEINNLFFSFPGVEELYQQAKQALLENKKIIFKTKKAIKNTDIYKSSFLKDGYQSSRALEDGLMLTHFGTLLSSQIAGQKVLGNYSLAFIEAQASKLYQEFYHEKQAVDHFYCAQGTASLNVLTETLKAFAIKKTEVCCVLMPANSFKAFQNNKYSTWINPEKETKTLVKKLYLLNKATAETEASLDLVSEKIINLQSPIYKIKTDDTWTLVVPWQFDLENLNSELSLELTNTKIKNLLQNQTHKEDYVDEQVFKCSLGQAARVVFALLGAQYENIPEAILNNEGGSWSSIAFENSSSGRFLGVNSMHEVLKNKWYMHQEIAIPWNYISFDLLNEQNKDLLKANDVFVLSFEDNDKSFAAKHCFLEANQDWKKIVHELNSYILKFVYREFSAIASKKYLLSTKEIMQLISKFLANWSISNYNNENDFYQEALASMQIPTELSEFLEVVASAHMLLSAQNDFHSCKTHSLNKSRFKLISFIENKLEKFCPISVKNFKHKVQNLLSKEIKSENQLLRN